MTITKKILLSIFLVVGIGPYFSITLENTLIAPIGNLIVNAIHGNFTANSNLSKHHIDLELKKYKWNYSVHKKRDRVIVYFNGLRINSSIIQKADMHIIEEDLSHDILAKLYKENIGKCDILTSSQETKKDFLADVSFCTRDKTIFAHYDIPDKKIMITYYPYIDSEKGREDFKEFIDGISVSK